MLKRTNRSLSFAIVGIVLIFMAVNCLGQGQKLAVFVQSAAAISTADLDLIKNYASQRCSIITGANVCSQGELMHAQRLTSTYVGNSITVEGMRQLAATLAVDHIVILRIVRWETKLSYKPERSLLLLAATSFLDTSLQILISPLGLFLGIEKQATVAIFATVFSPQGDVQFTTTVTFEDRPLFSLLTADPVEAAKGAIDTALYQVAVAL
jgi:hypothetical protein